MTNCLQCTTGTNCQSCDTNYYFNTTTLKCEVTCTAINFCYNCNLNALAANGIDCLACSPGYHAVTTSACTTQCSDGVVTPDESCDDGNSINGDGCSSACAV
jgi:cysteine-rich repeat protein